MNEYRQIGDKIDHIQDLICGQKLVEELTKNTNQKNKLKNSEKSKTNSEFVFNSPN